MNFVLTGGNGTLGREIMKIAKSYDISIKNPTSDECNIMSREDLKNHITEDIDAVIHAAALTDVRGLEANPIPSWDVNVVGTINVLKRCAEINKKMIFISTDYVFDGEKGRYKTTDPINPLSKYAKSKAAAELIVRTYDNSLVIRTSFFGYNFPYKKAFTDQWSSKDYVDVIAPMIIEQILKDKKGIAHIGSNRRSLYEIAKTRRPEVEKCSVKDLDFVIPHDISFGAN
ncbi:MAG: SDR family oxidoreductase [Candidatus Hodarchaeales archaeon]|jgi:dTDP-4-dehydrorhamnose reductase